MIISIFVDRSILILLFSFSIAAVLIHTILPSAFPVPDMGNLISAPVREATKNLQILYNLKFYGIFSNMSNLGMSISEPGSYLMSLVIYSGPPIFVSNHTK